MNETTDFKYLSLNIWQWFLTRYGINVTWDWEPNNELRIGLVTKSHYMFCTVHVEDFHDALTVYDALCFIYEKLAEDDAVQAMFITGFGEPCFKDLKRIVNTITSTDLNATFATDGKWGPPDGFSSGDF